MWSSQRFCIAVWPGSQKNFLTQAGWTVGHTRTILNGCHGSWGFWSKFFTTRCLLRMSTRKCHLLDLILSSSAMIPEREGHALEWVGTQGNAIPRPAISAIWRSQASKSAIFPWKRMFPGRKDSFNHEMQLVNLNMVKITAWLEIQGAHCKIEDSTYFCRGSRDLYRSQYFKITL